MNNEIKIDLARLKQKIARRKFQKIMDKQAGFRYANR